MIIKVLIICFIVIILRLFNLFVSSKLWNIVYCSLSLWFLFELIKGGLCIIKYREICLNLLTGSFDNPGPYGGFLSILASLNIALWTPRVLAIKNESDFISEGNKKETIRKKINTIINSLFIVVMVLAILVISATQSRSAILSLGCSALFYGMGCKSVSSRVKPYFKKYGLWFIIGASVIVTGAYQFKKPSADGRLFMDKMCLRTIYENGFKGVGLGRFGGAYGDTQARYFERQINQGGKDCLDWCAIDEHERITADCPDSAFNEYLFIGVELGVVVMLLFIGIIIYAIVVSYRKGTIWCYGMVSFAVFSFFSYPLHLWQFQFLIPILLSACIWDEKNDTVIACKACYNMRKLELILLTSTAVLLTLLIIKKMPEIKQRNKYEIAWEDANSWYKKGFYNYVVEDCDSLFSFLKDDYRFLFAYGQSLNKTGDYVLSDSVLKMGTKISSDPMFWNVMGNNSLAIGNYKEAEECYKHAFYMVPNRLYPLYLLAKLYLIQGDSARFFETAKIVESFKPKVESSKTESMRSEIRDLKREYMAQKLDYNK